MEDEWEALSRRRAEIEARLAAAPVVIVEGIADPTGVAAIKLGDAQQWTLRLTLDAWRVAGEPWQDGPLNLTRRADDDEIERYRQAARPLQPIRMPARLLMDASPAGPEAWLDALPSPIDDPELAERARQLQLPVTYEDTLFGICRFDRRVGWFEAHANWNDTDVRLYLEAATVEALPSVLEHAHALWRDAATWDARVSEQAVADLLKLKQSTWMEEGESEVSADDFKRRLALQSISIDAQAGFEFCFADGDLFFGHVVVVDGSLDRGPRSARIGG
ncbi:hypothetical protein WT72_30960 [Burkholderia pseudomultivorans]|uniref:DUF2262 domain-containing protein n=1 Tax=Burkholderia pseudomultivorans TaxID=1207504 RepID=UPI0007520EF9|nr:DUF2262 domain-containing protein [Burkholderia pseudomultivorans]KWI47340.1 hypothetical protein WT72_30960 [Burkholderia pseudomultivorans]